MKSHFGLHAKLVALAPKLSMGIIGIWHKRISHRPNFLVFTYPDITIMMLVTQHLLRYDLSYNRGN